MKPAALRRTDPNALPLSEAEQLRSGTNEVRARLGRAVGVVADQTPAGFTPMTIDVELVARLRAQGRLPQA